MAGDKACPGGSCLLQLDSSNHVHHVLEDGYDDSMASVGLVARFLTIVSCRDFAGRPDGQLTCTLQPSTTAVAILLLLPHIELGLPACSTVATVTTACSRVKGSAANADSMHSTLGLVLCSDLEASSYLLLLQLIVHLLQLVLTSGFFAISLLQIVILLFEVLLLHVHRCDRLA